MTRKKIVVTGASGFVAGSVLHFGAMEHEIHAFSQGEGLLEHPHIHWHRIEIEDRACIEETIRSIQPDALIHVAAIADIDFCENNPDIARAVNVEYTHVLAEVCAAQSIRMVFVSTDNVYDGHDGPYTAKCAANPVNYYGQTKVAAEAVVRELLPDSVIARLALVMGFPIIGGGNSFVMRMIAQWEKGESVGVPDNEIRSPIDIVTAGHALLELAIGDCRGVVLLGGADGLDRIDLVRQLAPAFGYASEMVHAFDPSNLPGRANRPVSVIFDMEESRAVLTTPIVGIAEVVELLRPFQRNAD